MTYRKLMDSLSQLSEKQLNSRVTIEMGEDCLRGERYRANLRICGSEHNSLDKNRPVLLVKIILFHC
jgi:hypothetical protein